MVSVTAQHLSRGRQPNFVAFSRERHLYSAVQPSCWDRPTFYTVSQKTSHLWLDIIDMHGSITIMFGTIVTEKVGNQSVLYFPTSTNLCFCTTWGNPKSASFHLNAACFLPKAHEHIKISPGYCWTTLHCQNLRLDAPDRTQNPAICYPHALCYPSLSLCWSLCKRWELFFVKPEWKSMDSINEISYYVNKCRCYQTHHG